MVPAEAEVGYGPILVAKGLPTLHPDRKQKKRLAHLFGSHHTQSGPIGSGDATARGAGQALPISVTSAGLADKSG